MNAMKINMRLFGAFRQYGDSVEISVEEGSSVSAVKQALVGVLGAQVRDLIADSVVANDDSILPGDFVLDEGAKLFILPPVCGG